MNPSSEQLVESFISMAPMPTRPPSECRICLEGSESGNLMTPCSCAGSIAHVHFSCLREWISKHHSVRLEEAPSLDYFACEMCKSRISFQTCKGFKCHSARECASSCGSHKFMFCMLLLLSVGFLALFVFGVLMVFRSGILANMGAAWFQTLLVLCSLLIVLIVQLLSTYLLFVKFFIQRTASIVTIAGIAEDEKTTRIGQREERMIRAVRKGSQDERGSPGRRSPEGRSRQSTCFSEGNLLTVEGRTRTNQNAIIPLDIVFEQMP